MTPLKTNVINVPRVPTTGASNLIPLTTVAQLTKAIGPKGDGLKTADWKPGVDISKLPKQAQERATPSSTAYEYTGALPTGAQGKVFALAVPNVGEGTWFSLFDQTGVVLAHAQTDNLEGWDLMLAKSDTYGGNTPPAKAPSNVVHIAPAPNRSTSDLLSLHTVAQLTEALGPQGQGLSTQAWTKAAITDLPKEAQSRAAEGATAYKLDDKSGNEAYVLKVPGTSYGAWMGLYDGKGVLAAHAQENDPVGWSWMVR